MAMTNLTRNLRDGELVISDGSSTPLTLTVALDEGNLSWTETENAIEILDRGTLDHVRVGDDSPCDLTFTSKWTQLIGKSATPADAATVYEMVNNTGSTYTTVSGTAGEKFQLQYVFTVTDPTGSNSETVTFAKVFKTSLACAEGDEYNTIEFSGRDFETAPTVARV